MSLRKRIAQIIEAEEAQDQNQDGQNEAAQQLIQEYSDCTNLAGGNKISPLIIIYKRDMQQLQTMATGAQMADYIVGRIDELNQQFRDAGIKSDQYDFVTNWAQKMKANMYKKKNGMDALMYFSNSVLKGDGLGRDREKASSVEASVSNELDFTSILADKNKAAFIGEMLLHFAKSVK